MERYLYTSSIDVSERVYWAWVAYEQDEEQTFQYTEPLDEGTTPEEAHLQAIQDAVASAAKPQSTLLMHDAEMVAWLTGQTEAPNELVGQVNDIQALLQKGDIQVKTISREHNPAWDRCVSANEEYEKDLRDYRDVLGRDQARVLEWIKDWELVEFTLCELFDGTSQEDLEVRDSVDRQDLLWRLRELRDSITLFMEDYGEER